MNNSPQHQGFQDHLNWKKMCQKSVENLIQFLQRQNRKNNTQNFPGDSCKVVPQFVNAKLVQISPISRVD